MEHVDVCDVAEASVNKMAKLSSEERALFPLSDIDSVVKLFRLHLAKNSEPNLAILSIIIGYIENTLTCSRGGSEPTPELDDDCPGKCSEDHRILPVVDYETVEALHQRFLAIIKAHVDVTAFGSPRYGTRELIKRISDVVWCTLSSSYYKDRAHLQSIYSYMTGRLSLGGTCYGESAGGNSESVDQCLLSILARRRSCVFLSKCYITALDSRGNDCKMYICFRWRLI